MLPLKLDSLQRYDQGLPTGGNMGRKARVDRTLEEKWQVVQEGLKSGHVSETCRRYQIAPTALVHFAGASECSKAALPMTGGE